MSAKSKILLIMFRRDVHNLEYDPHTQYRFHFIAAWFWFVSMLIIPFFDHPKSGSGWVALMILEASLWANFATHFGAMSSAIAANQTTRPPRPPFHDF